MSRSTIRARRTPLVGGILALAIVAMARDARAAGPSSQSSIAGTTGAFLGYSVAVSGTTAAVGAMNDDGGNGAVYVYVQTGSSWSLQQEVVASHGSSDDQFGYAVALSGDTLLVGASSGNQGQGAAYIFVRSGAVWSQAQELTETSGGANDGFGSSVALALTSNGTNGAAVVGAPGKFGSMGAADVYTLSSTWQFAEEFVGTSAGDQFGFSVGVSPDATTAVVGAYGASNRRGEAYVLTKSGATWATANQAIIQATGGQPQDSFGYSVAAADGEVLIGAYQNTSTTPGAAYVFTGSGTSWTQQAKLTPSDGANGDFFGYSVALDGNTAFVGAYEKAGTSGAAYVFTGSGPSWAQGPELTPPSPGQSFGYSVAVSGTNEVAGAISATNFAGAAYLYGSSGSPPAPALAGRAHVLWLALSLAMAGAIASRRARGRA